MNILNRKFWAYLFLGTSAFHCGEPRQQSRLAEDGYKGSIRISLANVIDATKNEFNVIVSTAKEMSQLRLCNGVTLAACSSSPLIAEKLDIDGERNFFKFPTYLQLSEPSRFILLATDGKGNDDARVLELTQKEDKEGSTPPGQGAGGNPDAFDASKGSGGNLAQVLERQEFLLGRDRSIYRLWAPADNSETKAHPLVVYLHGDTGSNFGPREIYSQVEAQYAIYHQDRPTFDQARHEAQQDGSIWKQSIFVSILTPATNGRFITWSTGLDEAQRQRNADYVHKLLQEVVYKKYNVDRSEVYFVGQSGGGIFLSQVFLPRHGPKYRGGFIMLCGALAPPSGFNPPDDFKGVAQLHFENTLGESERLSTGIEDSLASYRSLFGDETRVSIRTEGDGEHCQFVERSQPTIIDRVIKEMKARKP